MQYNINNISKEYDFYIDGASYAGNPRNNTMMYISKKVDYLIEKLIGKEECLVFLENGIEVTNDLKKYNCLIFSDNPQLEYAKFATVFAHEQRKEEREWGYSLTDEGYYIGKNTTIGENSYIEPNVVIGHNVVIGNNAVIMAGAIIKHSFIGDNFVCNENAVIGANGFTMADGDEKIRIPSLGRVVIKDNVEIGTNDNISRGSAGDTFIDNNVKIDALVHIGHDVVVKSNAEIVAGSVVGGYTEIGQGAFLGINSSVRNRKVIGDNVLVGMGAVVTKSFEDKCTIVGNPACKKYKC